MSSSKGVAAITLINVHFFNLLGTKVMQNIRTYFQDSYHLFKILTIFHGSLLNKVVEFVRLLCFCVT